MSRGANIARILVNSSGEVQQGSLVNTPGSTFASSAPATGFPTGTPLQVKSTLYQWYNTLALNTTYQNVPNMSVDITPMRANSIIRIDVRWFGELSDSAWNIVFAVSRNGTVINLPVQEGTRNRALGMPCQTYIADDNNSTPELCFISTMDAPNTTSLVTYRLVCISDTTRTLYTGRVVGGTTGSNYEQGSTEMIVTEYAG